MVALHEIGLQDFQKNLDLCNSYNNDLNTVMDQLDKQANWIN